MAAARLVQNAVTALRHPSIGIDFLTWRGSQLLGRPRKVHGAFGTHLRTSSFGDFRSTRAFVPDHAETLMLQSLASHTPVFLDVGANFGVWTLAMAAAHRSARVHCFEPTPSVYSILLDNIAGNHLTNISTHQLALSDSAGVCSFQVGGSQSIFNRLVPSRESNRDWRKDRFAGGHVVEVQTITLDEFCKQQGIDRVGFMKLDVEGNDLKVLRGASHLLRRKAIEMLWMEVEPDNLWELGDSIDDLVAFVAEMGYSFHPLEENGRPGPAVDVRNTRTLNMLVLPANRA